MKTIIQVVVLTAIVLMAGVARAREYKVQVTAQQGGREVADALKARIGATSRYALTDIGPESEMTVDIMCMTIQQAHGYICSMHITLWLAETLPLPIQLGGFQVAGPTAGDVAESFVQSFVINSSEDKNQAAVQNLFQRIGFFCKDEKHASYCRTL
jgi:hypothetical protein